jgi:hypothetical protein
VNGYAAFQPGAELSLVAKVYTAYSFTDRYSTQQLFHHFHDGKIRVRVYAKVTRESMDCLIVHVVFDNWGRTLYQICPKPVIPDWSQVSLDVNLRFIVRVHMFRQQHFVLCAIGGYVCARKGTCGFSCCGQGCSGIRNQFSDFQTTVAVCLWHFCFMSVTEQATYFVFNER